MLGLPYNWTLIPHQEGLRTKNTALDRVRIGDLSVLSVLHSDVRCLTEHHKSRMNVTLWKP